MGAIIKSCSGYRGRQQAFWLYNMSYEVVAPPAKSEPTPSPAGAAAEIDGVTVSSGLPANEAVTMTTKVQVRGLRLPPQSHCLTGTRSLCLSAFTPAALTWLLTLYASCCKGAVSVGPPSGSTPGTQRPLIWAGIGTFINARMVGAISNA